MTNNEIINISNKLILKYSFLKKKQKLIKDWERRQELLITLDFYLNFYIQKKWNKN